VLAIGWFITKLWTGQFIFAVSGLPAFLDDCIFPARSIAASRSLGGFVRTILLLTISNIFMTFAWYGHLKYRSEALWKVIMVSWGIAFFEYCFQVPANRIGSYEFTTAQLKTIQEVITLSVFSVFSVLYLGEKLKWNYFAGFACIVLGVFFVFHRW
jgi:uncharacterized protein